MSDQQNIPAPNTLWRHKKGGLYFVVGVAICSTNGEGDGVERAVVYYSLKYAKLRYRSLAEFTDGRFLPVPEGEL
jgi:hypothetical protein